MLKPTSQTISHSLPLFFKATLGAILAVGMLSASLAQAQEAEWIWAADHTKGNVPFVSCHFRKTFNVSDPEGGEITIAADDSFELYINGKKVGVGESARSLSKFNISQYLSRGSNLIAVRVANTNDANAALVARVFVKERGGRWMSHSTNTSWKTSLSPLPFWNMKLYNDSRWPGAQSWGKLGETPPWDRPAHVAQELPEQHERFKINREFRVERVVGDEDCGSIIAMSFNEFGQILASQEEGPLLLIADTNGDTVPDRVTEYCDKVTSCQGILALNGEVFLTGMGPEGVGLYRCGDYDGDSKLETVKLILKFKGDPGEHGPHGITLGPDGKIYVMVGNHAQVDAEISPRSPYKNSYSGDIVPRYEDPGGHAAGVKAPGGTIVRTDLDGKNVEVFAGGLRNAYDLAFNREGDLFTHDSDMETDKGSTWYRPTQVYHVTPGAEIGWRSGWAKWPDYYVDATPAIVDTGRGSPTGAVFYNHHAFPVRYHNALFLGDWSEGRIIAVRTKKIGASYATHAETFLQGEPLNVTDLEIGPEGGIYFCTGGRGTTGGIYRVTWRGEIPEGMKNLGEGLSEAIRHPQLNSAWARQRLASLKQSYKADWDTTLVGVARSDANPARYRLRALDLMQLYGPFPSDELLLSLSKEQNAQVRGKAAEFMGVHATEISRVRLLELLGDDDRTVRRKACEALTRAGQHATLTKLIGSLVSDDRFESYAARRLLETMPVESWRDRVLKTRDQRLFIQGSLALLVAHPSRANALAVNHRCSEFLKDFVSDDNYIDMMRLMQVAVERGGLTPEDAPILREQLAEEFPSGNSKMNRELVRLLAFYQATSPMDRYIDYLESDVSAEDKMHLAMHLRFIKTGWTSERRMGLLRYFSQAKKENQGTSVPIYIANVSRDFATSFNATDVPIVLKNAKEWPEAALAMLYKLPDTLDDPTYSLLVQVDESLETADSEDEDIARLKIGIAAVLARSGDVRSMRYLRGIWDRDPERRRAVALGLATKPDGENWEYLVRTIPELEGESARDVLMTLKRVGRRPETHKAYRAVILKGLELEDEGAPAAIALLEHWTSEQMSGPDDSWQDALKSWQAWYNRAYPDLPEPALPSTTKEDMYDYEQLLAFLKSDEGNSGSPIQGAAVFKTAQCAKCHRMGDQGESMGPDLTNLTKRFTEREILESVVYPSHVISNQYASKTVITDSGRKYTGIIGRGAPGTVVVLQADGKKKQLSEDEVEEVIPSKVSAMPEGLLNELSLQEISDLFAYLLGRQARVATRTE